MLDFKSTVSNGERCEVSADAPIVEFDNVSLHYEGAGAPSLSGISFAAGEGDTIGIIGGTGSGKTSLINMIPGFYPAKEGTVMIGGAPVSEYSEDTITDIIGIVPQRAVLFRGTVRDNMRYRKADATDEEIWAALEVAMAREVVEDKGGLDAMIEEGGSNLSGGQRQRLTIARALVGSPRILILDDSASALDFATDAALRKNIKELTGTTTFIVSQRTSSVMHADKIIVLEDGEMESVGTHSELLKSSTVYREIYESQFGEEVTANG